MRVKPREEWRWGKGGEKKTMNKGCHQMVNTEIRFIIVFAVEDGEPLQSQHTISYYAMPYYTILYWELTMAQIMNSLPNSDLN